MFKIEDGLPIPKPKFERAGKSPQRIAIEKLQPGQSFLMEPGEQSFRKARNVAYYYRNGFPRKNRPTFAVRVVADGIRVWRVS